jgi:hypothetical protein
MDEMNKAHEAAIERIALPLRDDERLPAGFEDRLLGHLQAEVTQAAQRRKERPRSWWVTPRQVSRAPIMSFAIAAGFAFMVAVSTLAVARGASVSRWLAGRADTVHVIRFVYLDPSATAIDVVGDFNGWGARKIPLTANADGVWSASVALPAGAHEYAFVVNHDQWVSDPAAALSSRDEFGTPTSRMRVGAVDFSATE